MKLRAFNFENIVIVMTEFTFYKIEYAVYEINTKFII